jgi:hypothetical protein
VIMIRAARMIAGRNVMNVHDVTPKLHAEHYYKLPNCKTLGKGTQKTLWRAETHCADLK